MTIDLSCMMYVIPTILDTDASAPTAQRGAAMRETTADYMIAIGGQRFPALGLLAKGFTGTVQVVGTGTSRMYRFTDHCHILKLLTMLPGLKM